MPKRNKGRGSPSVCTPPWWWSSWGWRRGAPGGCWSPELLSLCKKVRWVSSSPSGCCWCGASFGLAQRSFSSRTEWILAWLLDSTGCWLPSSPSCLRLGSKRHWLLLRSGCTYSKHLLLDKFWRHSILCGLCISQMFFFFLTIKSALIWSDLVFFSWEARKRLTDWWHKCVGLVASANVPYPDHAFRCKNLSFISPRALLLCRCLVMLSPLASNQNCFTVGKV